MSLRASEMGWTEPQFWRSTFVEFNWSWVGYYRKSERYSLEGARMIYGILYNVNAGKGKQKRDLRKLMELSIDLEKPRMTQDEWNEYKNSIPEHWYNHKKDN